MLTKDAAKKPQDGFGGNSSMVGSSSLGGIYNNKMAPEALIGPPEDKKKKTIVVLSNKEVEQSRRDIVTTLPRKVCVRDLVNVMRADPRLSHRPLLYQLQNEWINISVRITSIN